MVNKKFCKVCKKPIHQNRQYCYNHDKNKTVFEKNNYDRVINKTIEGY